MGEFSLSMLWLLKLWLFYISWLCLSLSSVNVCFSGCVWFLYSLWWWCALGVLCCSLSFFACFYTCRCIILLIIYFYFYACMFLVQSDFHLYFNCLFLLFMDQITSAFLAGSESLCGAISSAMPCFTLKSKFWSHVILLLSENVMLCHF